MNALFVRFFALAAIVAPTVAHAATLLPAYTFPDGSAGFEFRTSGGLTNPGVLVGFNPQPDPPGVPVRRRPISVIRQARCSTRRLRPPPIL